jgi:hypothetical protein
MLPDDDLSILDPEDLQRVCVYIEDRFVNAVTPLAVRLQGELPDHVATNPTLQVAQRVVDRILAVVEEVRSLSDRSASQCGGSGLGGRFS